LLEGVNATSSDGSVRLDIASGTTLLDANSSAVSEITVEPVTAPATAPEGYTILKSFAFTPEGATFNPGITITISFDASSVPAGGTVALAYYRASTGTWEFVTGMNNGDGTATFTLTHFSDYTLMYRGATKAASSSNVALWIGIAVAVILVLLVIVLLMRRKPAKA